MRRVTPVLAVLALAALAAPAAAAPGAGAPFLGPWAGALAGGEAHAHTYDNNPLGQPCIEVVTTYVATLHYQPATADVTFRVAGEPVPAENGSAVHLFRAGYCARFPLQVQAGEGETAVAYQVDADRSSPLTPVLGPGR